MKATKVIAYGKGYFKLCIGFVCTKHKYPIVNKWQYGDGTTDPD